MFDFPYNLNFGRSQTNGMWHNYVVIFEETIGSKVKRTRKVIRAQNKTKAAKEARRQSRRISKNNHSYVRAISIY